MALRFRKSIKLAPGIRMNFSGSGSSWTIGPRGASIGIGKRGAYINAGIPGTGFSSRQKLLSGGSPQSNSRSAQAATTTISLTVSVSDDGVISFNDANGNQVPEWQVQAAKKQQGEKIKALIQGKCDEINGQIEALGRIHEYTSAPVPHVFVATSFGERIPSQPTRHFAGFFCRWFKSCVAKVDAKNRLAQEQFAIHLQEWNLRKAAHEAKEDADRRQLELVNAGDESAVQRYFESVMQDIQWPRETLVTFDILSQGRIVIDVDLPEIEDMPNKTATVPQRGFRLSVKEISATAIQKLYMGHVHALGFRIAGEAFAASPTILEVVVSGYSQRPNKATGVVGDEYLYSARIRRENWTAINFHNLANLDAVEAFGRFDLRRDMTKTGVFKAIQPFESGAIT